MARDPFANYDAWLEAPYQRNADSPGECPECGSENVHVDTAEQSIECNECGWSDGTDWDAVAEARAEAKADAREERYDF